VRSSRLNCDGPATAATGRNQWAWAGRANTFMSTSEHSEIINYNMVPGVELH